MNSPIGNIRTMMWSVFSHAHILENEFVQEIVEVDKSGNINRPIFDFIIPEYRLVVDVFDATIDNNSGKWESSFQANYKYLIIEPDPIAARRQLIDTINEIGILRQDGVVGLLTPRMSGDAGFDLVCNQNALCKSKTITDIPSSVHLEIPNHLYAIVTARSSASKKGLQVLPGILDPGYRNQLYTMVYNFSDEDVVVDKGNRIAQLLFIPRMPHLRLSQYTALRPSERQFNGFGSTGT